MQYSIMVFLHKKNNSAINTNLHTLGWHNSVHKTHYINILHIKNNTIFCLNLPERKIKIFLFQLQQKNQA